MGLTSSKVQWEDIPGTIYQLGNFVEHSTLWDLPERACLRDYLGTLIKTLSQPDSGFPWAHSGPSTDRQGWALPSAGVHLEHSWKEDLVLQDYFRRVRLAIPKSNHCKEIFRWSDDPSFNSVEGLRGFDEDFTRAPRKIQVGLAHVYALFLFLWAMQKKENPSERFYQSDIPYHMYQSDQGYDSMRVQILLQALEKIAPVEPSEEKCGQCVDWGTTGRHFIRDRADLCSLESSSSSQFLCGKHRERSPSSLELSSYSVQNQDEIIEKLDQVLNRLQIIYDLQRKGRHEKKSKK